MKVSIGHFKLFSGLIIRIALVSLKNKYPLVALIFALNALSAISKLAVVLIIALAVKALGNESGFSMFGFYIENSIQSIFILGGGLGIVALVGAICGYYSVYNSRALGRWANQKAMMEIQEIISLPPAEAQRVKLVIPQNPNILLTQLPLHTGLAYEAIAMMLNPALLILFSLAALFYQNSIFALAVLFGSVFIFPILVKTGIGIQRNAKSFYGEQALNMGSGINTMITLLNSQHGIIPKSNDDEKRVFSKIFFDSFDKNILANHKTALVIAVLEAVLRPAIFIAMCTMMYLGKFTVEAAIAFLGSLAYFLSSSRTVSSLLTNLLRFQPQVKQYFDFVDAFDNIDLAEPLNPKQNDKIGSVTVVLLPKPMSTLTLGYYLPSLLNQKGSFNQQNVFFVFSNFRFHTGISILEQLCGNAEPSEELKDKTILLCENIDATSSMLKLKDGLDTKLSEHVWNQLNSAARVALRTVPLALKPSGSTVLIDINVVKNLAPNLFPKLINSFSHCDLYITTNGEKVGQIIADGYYIIDSLGKLNYGDRVWFETELTRHKEEMLQKIDNGAALDTTIYL